MYYTTDAHVHAHYARMEAVEAADVETLDDFLPGWEHDEQVGEGLRFVPESDFPIYDPTADDGLVSEDDWQALIEMTWTDSAEWPDF